MPKFKDEVQSFRHRGFQRVGPPVADAPIYPIEMVYGDGPAPKNDDGTDAQVLWDHFVTEEIHVVDFKDRPQA